jgi:ribonuclease HII
LEHNLASFDNQIRQSGITNLCGIDEAGRGPLAGPVVAAALILKDNTEIPGIKDSKKLNETTRENLEPLIKESSVTYGIGLVGPDEIDRMNILQATFLAMRKAINELLILPDYIIIDGRDFPKILKMDSEKPINGKAIIGGDHKSQCIAGASILAKVYRDRLMRDYDQIYPKYGFARHKGYATHDHRDKILDYGPCIIHRKSFLNRILPLEKSLNLQNTH